MTYVMKASKGRDRIYTFTCDGKPNKACPTTREIKTKGTMRTLFFRMRELGWRRIKTARSSGGKDICPLCVPDHFEGEDFL